MDKSDRGGSFFIVMGLILIALVIGGFVPLAFSRPGGPMAISPLSYVHGLVFFTWYVLFVVQARLVSSGNVRLHMTLGKASVALSCSMVFLGILVTRGAYANPEWSIAGFSQAASTAFPLTDIFNFAVMYSFALAQRRTPDAHKRLMLMAGILMMDPAISRLVFNLGIPPVFIVVFELLLFIAVITYDVKTRRKPHWATLFGIALFVLAMVTKFLFAQQSWWAALVDAILG